jgi:hypothetical protein
MYREKHRVTGLFCSSRELIWSFRMPSISESMKTYVTFKKIFPKREKLRPLIHQNKRTNDSIYHITLNDKQKKVIL